MKKSSLFFALPLFLLAASCAKEPNIEVNADPNLIPLNITGSIDQQHTKATADGFVDKDAIGLYAVNYTDNNTVAGTLQVSGNQADNVKYVFDETSHKWTPVKSVYYKDVNTNVDIYLYYPYQASISNMTAGNFEVSKDQSSEKTATSLGGYEASDFLWGKKAGVVPSEASVGVNLSHKMAAVNLTLNEGTGFEPDEFEGLSKSVILVNTTRKATIDYTTGTVTKLGDPQLDGIVMCPQNDGSFRAVVVPQSVAAGTNLFAITIGGISYGFSQNASVEYLAGKQLNANITINKKADGTGVELVAGDWQITDWTEDLNTHGGEARQYFVVTVSEPGTLGATIQAMGKNPDKIRNLKVVGTVCAEDFYFMRDNMAILEAINMKESVIAAPKNQTTLVSASTTSDEYKYLCKALGEPDEITGSTAYWYDNENNIPQNAFKDKKSLCYFCFPEDVNVIGQYAFGGTKLSGALVIPDGVKATLDFAFSNTIIGSVVFPSSLGYVGDYSFLDCSSLSGSLALPHSVTFIGSEAFESCKGFSGSLILPENLIYIGPRAFLDAGTFTGDLIVPEGVKMIPNMCFYESTFTGRLILNNVNEVQQYAFIKCGFQGELVIPNGTIEITGSSFAYNKFSKVIFPQGFKVIGSESNGVGAFQGNEHLMEIEFNSDIVSIGSSAFQACSSLRELHFPGTIQSIQKKAFSGCHNLSSIISEAIEVPSIQSGAFDGVAKDNFTVEVPAQSVKRYQAEPGWSDFKRIAAHYDFSLSRERMRALNGEMTRTYTLRAPANFNWSIESKPEWVTVTPESGTGKTDVTVTISEMARTSEQFEVNEGTYNSPSYKKYKGRAGEIVFKLDDKDYTYSMAVEQYDYDYADGYVETHQSASRGDGIDIIFVGEGYDAKDIAKGTFLDNADEAFAAFFDIEPYKTYKEYFNVHSVIAMSDESGIGTVNTIKDTKFGTYFTQNRIKVPASEPVFAWARKADDGVDFTKALVINLMNTSTYEGICAMYGDGSAIAFCPVSRDAYPYDFRGIIQHEAGGHGFGKLGDEYIYHNAFIQTCMCQDGCDHPQSDNDTQSSFGKFKSLGWYKNLSMNGDANQVPWAHLIYHSKYSDYVDMYEGGYMHSYGMYRSEATSCMNNNIPYYSAISRQAIVERIMEIAGEEFTLEKFYQNDSDAFGTITKGAWVVPFDRTFGVDPKWSRGSEKGSVVYMGAHPDYSKIK